MTRWCRLSRRRRVDSAIAPKPRSPRAACSGTGVVLKVSLAIAGRVKHGGVGVCGRGGHGGGGGGGGGGDFRAEIVLPAVVVGAEERDDVEEVDLPVVIEVAVGVAGGGAAG